MPNANLVKVYIPQGLLIVALIAGAGWAYKVGQTAEANAEALATKADAAEVQGVQREVEKVQSRLLDHAGALNYIMDGVNKIADKVGVDLPARPIVSEDP